jgi:hypothetical protein
MSIGEGFAACPLRARIVGLPLGYAREAIARLAAFTML